MRKHLWLPLVLLAAAAASGRQADVSVRQDVMVPARDGVRLALDIYLPAKDGVALPGAFPTILTRTPYDKTAAGQAREARWFAARGYAVVCNDVRGRYASEGVWRMVTTPSAKANGFVRNARPTGPR